MENLKEQIFQATSDFLTAIQQLTEQHTADVLQVTEQHTAAVLQDTFSSAVPSTSTAPRSRGAKRGPDELEQLSKRFVRFVNDNPGLRIEQINAQLGTTTPELMLPIRKLIASGDIKVKGQKRATTYFAGKNSTAPTAISNGKGSAKKSAKTSKKSRKKQVAPKRGARRSKPSKK